MQGTRYISFLTYIYILFYFCLLTPYFKVEYLKSSDQMDGLKYQERVAARFEKVLRLYWDGIPMLPFVISNESGVLRTFKFRELNYSPDYYGEVTELPLIRQALEFKGFFPLRQWESQNSSISCRIGSHYSPYVGLFRYYNTKEGLSSLSVTQEESSSKNQVKVIRIPKDPCELPQEFGDEVGLRYGKYLRTSKLLDLYYPIVKEFCPITLNSLKQIVKLGTISVPHHSKESVVREIQVVKEEYTRWICECVFYYMATDQLFWKILTPLQLVRRPKRVPYIITALPPEERVVSKENFQKARSALIESIVWRKDTQNYFLSLRTLWNTRFRRLVFFDLTAKEWVTEAQKFGKQLKASLRSALARIRIEFYSYVEEFFFTYISNARNSIFLTEEELGNSVFQRIFVATRLFLTEQLRYSLLAGLEKIVEFFSCFGNFRCSCVTTKRIAEKYPVIGINLVVSESSVPRAIDFNILVTALRSLFDDIREKSKELPRLEYIFFPTLKFDKQPITFISETEIIGYRSVLMEILDEVSAKIDKITAVYSYFSILPSKDESIAIRGEETEIREHINLLREKYYGARRATSDVVFCGRFAINCRELKDHYARKWEEFLLKFYEELHKSAKTVIDRVEEKCLRAQAALHKIPVTVADLEQYLIECASAKTLAETIQGRESQEVIKRIRCMEECQVPIDSNFFYAAEKMMKWPQILLQDLHNAESIKEKSRPLLHDHVNRARHETRDHINTLSTGVIELYNMFNLDICDIAAQTCIELGELVTEIHASVEQIHHQEKALGIPTVDSFEDLYPLVNHFEIIEQFWMTIYKSQALKEYYSSPIRTLSGKMIESEREWRRLLHSSVRNLRGYPPLVRLGQQQEAILARFEALEEFINLASTPGLRKQHWKEIGRLLYSKLQEDANLVTEMNISLQRLLDADVLLYLPEIKRIVEEASGDFSAESILEQMRSSSKKIHFRVESIRMSAMTTRLYLPEVVHTEILSHIETYVKTCRDLRWKSGLSSAIIKALNEWEGSTEKMRDMLIQWKKIEDQWVPFENYFVTVQKAQKKERKQEMVPILDCLTRAHDAFHQLYLKIGKPQFSLYMAIVQETVMEHLSAAKTALADLRPMLGNICEKKRAGFSRFYFLTDDQLVTYLSTFNVDQLRTLLPYMYPRLRHVEIQDDYVVAFSTDSGFTIKADPPFPLTDDSSTEWMSQFDKVLSRSVFTFIKKCCLEYGKNLLENWIDAHCPQMLIMGLRVAHTKRMREILSFNQEKGLRAYQLQLRHVKDELCRISIQKNCPKRKRGVIGEVLSYLFNVEVDVATALGQRISTLTELDGTSMIQTFLNESDTTTRILGVDFVNGTEFYGEHALSLVMTPEVVEHVVILLMLILLGKASPTVCGVNRNALPSIAVSLIGRYCIPVQCFPKMCVERILSYCRGAIQIGGILCFHDLELMDRETHVLLREIFAKVSRASSLKSIKSGDYSTATLPIGPFRTIVPVQVNPYFACVFTCQDFSSLPMTVAFDTRPVHMPPADCTVIIRGCLYTYGFTDEFTSSLLFGSFFELFHRVRSQQFTMGCLFHVVHLAANRLHSRPMIERLCEGFVRFYFSTLQDDSSIRNLFFSSLVDVLGMDSDGSFFKEMLQKLSSVERQYSQEFFSRFADLMSTSRKVIISGPPFSGKTNAWKKWVGNSQYYIFSPSLMSSADFFGHKNSRGTVPALGREDQSVNHRYVIVEGGSHLSQPFWGQIEDYARLFTGDNVHLAAMSSFIITTRRLHHMNPAVMSGFSQFNMNVSLTWNRFLKRSLAGCAHFDLIVEIMEVVLGTVFDGFKKQTNNLFSPLYIQKEYQLAAVMRCANICKKWYEHGKKRFELSSQDQDNVIDERAYAAHCAVFASVWGIGLRLPLEDRGIITWALESSEKSLQYIAESFDITVSVLPSFSKPEANNVLNLIPTPCGWRSHENAEGCGFLYPWSSHVHLNPQQPMSFQIFEMQSRLPTVQAAECLLGCGTNVIFCGDGGSGRTTLLQTTRYCDQWSPCYIGCSKGISAISISEKISSRLFRRSNGVYGPAMGRRLTVCVDDLHLSDKVEEDLPIAANLIGFCTKFNYLISSSSGCVPVTDVLFCGASNHEKLSSTVSRGCTEIYLPPLVGDELAGGLWELFESCCAKKRVEHLPRQAATFVAVAHSYYIRCIRHLRFPKRSLYFSGYDILLSSSLELLPDCFRDAIRASEIVRSSLLTTMPDIQVIGNTFHFVEELYSAMLLSLAPESIGSFREHLGKLANITLGLCTQDDSFKKIQVLKEIPFSTTTDAVEETVEGWILSLEEAVDVQKVEVLETLMAKGQEPNFPRTDAEYGNSSVLISFPSVLSPTKKGSGHFPRQGSMRGAGAFRAAKRKISFGQGFGRLSHTYPTTWLVSHASFLVKILRQDEFHFMFVGKETFGLKRLIRIVCHSSGMPLAMFRSSGAEYTKDNFWKELKACIFSALVHDSVTVVYLPFSILRVSGIISLIDLIIRTGDVSELFSADELTALAKGYSITQRSLRALNAGELLELCRRVQHLMHFILHFDTSLRVKEYREGYPCITHLFPLSLHSPHSIAQFRLELVIKILEENQRNNAKEKYQEKMEKELGTNEEAAKLICSIYDTVREEVPTKMEQLVEFSCLAQKFRAGFMKCIQYNTRMKSTVWGNGLDGRKHKTEIAENVKKLAEIKAEKRELGKQIDGDKEVVLSCEEAMSLGMKRAHAEEEENRQIMALNLERENRKKRALRLAAHALKNAKGLDLRNFSQCRAPLKGSLLVNAVLWTFGKTAPPNAKNNPTELWNFGLKTICKTGFVEALLDVQPEKVGDPSALLKVKKELSELHLTGSLKYGQLVIDYILALTEMVHVEESQQCASTSTNRDSASSMEVLYSQLQAAEDVLGLHMERIETLEKMEAKLEEEKRKLVKRGVVLNEFGVLVDKFTDFIEENDSKHVEIVEGDILMAAALFSLMLMHRNLEKIYKKVQNMLLGKGIRTSLTWEKMILEVIFPAQSLPFEAVISSQLPPRHHAVLYGFLGGIYCRWPLIGGVTEEFESTFMEFLKFQCRHCRTISAYDPSLKSSLIEALKDGSGIIIRDVVGEWAAEQLRPLHQVLPRINEVREMHRGKIPPHETFTIIVFGKEVEVNARFFMLATSASFVSCESSQKFTEFFQVTNLFEMPTQSYRYERLLSGAPSIKNIQDEIGNKRQLVVDEFLAFMRCYETATDFIAEGILEGDLSSIRVFSESIDDMTRHNLLLRQYHQQYEILRNKHAGAWLSVAEVIERCAENLQFIEFHKLERPWCDIVLNEYIRGMCILAPQLVSRIAPRMFVDIPLPERHFYAIVNFLGNLLRGFVHGWPSYFRGFFSLLLVSDVISFSSDIQEQRGVLFSEKVPLLTDEQVSTLRAILSDNGLRMYNKSENVEKITTSRIKQSFEMHYANSGDPLLVSLLSGDVSMLDDEETLVENFFFALLNVNLERAGKLGEEIVNSFFTAALDSSKALSDWGGSIIDAEGREDEKGGESSLGVTSSGGFGKSQRSISEGDGGRQGSKKDGGGDVSRGTSSSIKSHENSKKGGGWTLSTEVSTPNSSTGTGPQGKEGEKLDPGVPYFSSNASELDLLHQATRLCIPSCILVPMNEESSILSRMRNYTLLLGWEFQWVAVTKVSIIQSIVHLLLQFFCRSSTSRSGAVLTLHIDLPAHLAVPSSMLSPVQRAELIAFKEEIARIMDVFHGRPQWRTGGGNLGSIISTPSNWRNVYSQGSRTVNLVFVMSNEAHNLLFGNCDVYENPSPILRCLYFFPLFLTPQQHLDALLKTIPHLQKTLGAANFAARGVTAGNFPEKVSSYSSTNGGSPGSISIRQGSHGGVGSLGAIGNGTTLMGRDVGRRTSGTLGRHWEWNRLAQLRKMVLLAGKEMLIVHAAMTQRFRMIQFNWLRNHQFLCPSQYGKSQCVIDENLTLLLMLLQGWVEWTETVLQEIGETFGAEEEEEGDRVGVHHSEGVTTETITSSSTSRASTFPPIGRRGSTVVIPPPSPRGTAPTPTQMRYPLSPQDISREVSTIFAMTKNRERYAHLFYRQQLRSFQYKIGRDLPLPNQGSGGGGASRTLQASTQEEEALIYHANEGKSTLQAFCQHYSSVVSCPEYGPPKLSLGIFNTLQKMTFLVLSSSGLSGGEIKGLQYILKKVVVSPSNSQVVSCDYTPIRPRCPLLLDQEVELVDFQKEVADMMSDLVELCGDAFATVSFRQSVEERIQEYLFFYVERCGEDGSSGGVHSSNGNRGNRSRVTSNLGLPNGGGRFRSAEQDNMSGAKTITGGRASGQFTSPSTGSRAAHEKRASQSQKSFSSSNIRERCSWSGPLPFGRIEQRTLMPRVCLHNSDEQSSRPTFHSLHPTVRASRWNLLYRDSYLSSVDLASFSCLVESCGSWLLLDRGKSSRISFHNKSSTGVVSEGPRRVTSAPAPLQNIRFSPTPTSEMVAWELEKYHALDLLQFYFSPKSPKKFLEERERLVGTYEMLASTSGQTGCETIRSCWLSALGNPAITLRLIAAGVHSQLLARLSFTPKQQEQKERGEKEVVGGDAVEDKKEMKNILKSDNERGVKSIVIVVTLRRLLWGGDVVLSRAYFSASLQENIKKLTGWRDEWFPHPSGSDQRDCPSSEEGKKEVWGSEESSPLGKVENPLSTYQSPLSLEGLSPRMSDTSLNPEENESQKEEVVVVVRMMEKTFSSSEQTVVLLEAPVLSPGEKNLKEEEKDSDEDIMGNNHRKTMKHPSCLKPQKIIFSNPYPVEEARGFTWHLPSRGAEPATPHRSFSAAGGGMTSLSSSVRQRSSTVATSTREFTSDLSPTFFTAVPLSSAVLESKKSLLHTTPEGSGNGSQDIPFTKMSALRCQLSTTPIDILYESRVLREREEVVGGGRQETGNREEESVEQVSNVLNGRQGGNGAWASSTSRTTRKDGNVPPRKLATHQGSGGVESKDGEEGRPKTGGQEGPFVERNSDRGGGGAHKLDNGLSLSISPLKTDCVIDCPTPAAAAIFSPSALGKVPFGVPSLPPSHQDSHRLSSISLHEKNGKTSSFFIDTVWERMGPENLCVVWESEDDDDTPLKGFEIPLNGLTEYYIYVR